MSVRPSPRRRGSIPPSGYVQPVPAARTLASTPVFRAACEAAGVEPTVRQARAYLAGRGRWAP